MAPAQSPHTRVTASRSSSQEGNIFMASVKGLEVSSPLMTLPKVSKKLPYHDRAELDDQEHATLEEIRRKDRLATNLQKEHAALVAKRVREVDLEVAKRAKVTPPEVSPPGVQASVTVTPPSLPQDLRLEPTYGVLAGNNANPSSKKPAKEMGTPGDIGVVNSVVAKETKGERHRSETPISTFFVDPPSALAQDSKQGFQGFLEVYSSLIIQLEGAKAEAERAEQRATRAEEKLATLYKDAKAAEARVHALEGENLVLKGKLYDLQVAKETREKELEARVEELYKLQRDAGF